MLACLCCLLSCCPHRDRAQTQPPTGGPPHPLTTHCDYAPHYIVCFALDCSSVSPQTRAHGSLSCPQPCKTRQRLFPLPHPLADTFILVAIMLLPAMLHLTRTCTGTGTGTGTGTRTHAHSCAHTHTHTRTRTRTRRHTHTRTRRHIQSCDVTRGRVDFAQAGGPDDHHGGRPGCHGRIHR